MKTIHRLEIVVAESDYDCATGLLALEVPFGWEEQSLPTGETRFRVHCEQKDFLERLQQLLKQTVPAAESALSELEETDWLAAWRQFFTPVCCGNHFVVLPPWLADTQDFPGRTPILIEPKSAFGTGHHATTALCLRVVSDLLEAGRLQHGQHFLDLGTGSGVLGIGCKRGTSAEALEAAFAAFCARHGLAAQTVTAAASIDLKQNEPGLLAFCQAHSWPVRFYSAAQLRSAPGQFTPSSFVQSVTGVDNVCERAAVLDAGGSLFYPKFACNGVTFALACRPFAPDWRWLNG